MKIATFAPNTLQIKRNWKLWYFNSEKGIQSKLKKEEGGRRTSEVASTEEPNPSSVYISDFESDSGSELAEKHVFTSHAKNPNTIHFDNSVFTRNDKPENIIMSSQSQNKYNIELSWKHLKAVA